MEVPRRNYFDLVGEGRQNVDGTFRQGELWRCLPGERVGLIHDQRNQYDSNAIFVVSCRGIGIGYVRREDNVWLVKAIERVPYVAFLSEIRGGLPGFLSYGAEIGIAWNGEALKQPEGLDRNQLAYRETAKPHRLKKFLGIF
jgi:hypothetical protein